MTTTEPRLLTPLDLPLARRLIADRLPLDMCLLLTRGLPGLEELLLAAVPLTDRSTSTLILRSGNESYLGQFRFRADREAAQVTFLAPEPSTADPHAWATLLEALAFEAGKRGAHLLNAEVDPEHPGFPAFRQAGFAVYSKQVILRRLPGATPAGEARLLRPATRRDTVGIMTLQTNTVPRLLQQADDLQPATEYRALVYEQGEQILAYLAIAEGRSGIVVKPYFHPEAYDRAPALVLAALAHLPRAAQVPVYLYARAYQDWLRGVLERMEFEAWAHQALMVKYTVVRVGRVQPVTLPELEANRLAPPVPDGPLPLRRLALLRWQKCRIHQSPLRHNGR